jgi:hypothetical protein
VLACAGEYERNSNKCKKQGKPVFFHLSMI